jgi:hypothetical protein
VNQDELRAVIQSDFKLWEQSGTVTEGGTITKVVDLPYGIGHYELIFEGIKNAETRRNAAAIWGQSIRDVVDSAIGDEAVTSRAAQAAARASEDDGQDGRLINGHQNDARSAEVPTETSVPTLSSAPAISSDPSSQLDDIRRRRDEYLRIAKGLDLEIKALAAYVEVMNASKVQEKEDGNNEVASSEALPDGQSESG